MGIRYQVWEAFPKSRVQVEYEISNHLPRLGFNLLINIPLFIDITYNALHLLRFESYHRKALESTFHVWDKTLEPNHVETNSKCSCIKTCSKMSLVVTIEPL